MAIVREIFGAAHEAHADIATFPESSVLGWENPDAHKLATPIPGTDSERIADLARKCGLMIAIGLDERCRELLYDSAILVDKKRKLLWKCRKLSVLPELIPCAANPVIHGGVKSAQGFEVPQR